VEAIRTLVVQLEADVEAEDSQGRRSLHHAAEKRHLEAMRTLVGLGADVRTLLHSKDPIENPTGTALPKVDHSCTSTPSLIPTVMVTRFAASLRTDNSPQPKEAQLTTVSRSNIRLNQHFDSSAQWSDGPEVAHKWLFPYPILKPTEISVELDQVNARDANGMTPLHHAAEGVRGPC
jgi:ankyrin repeat protein